MKVEHDYPVPKLAPGGVLVCNCFNGPDGTARRAELARTADLERSAPGAVSPNYWELKEKGPFVVGVEPVVGLGLLPVGGVGVEVDL